MKNRIKILVRIILAIIAIISFIYIPSVHYYVSFLVEVICSWLMAHPFFVGVMLSWLVAAFSTGIVLFIADMGKNEKKVEYNKVFRQSEAWLRGITIVVLFYIAIHLASKAFYTGGIPIFGEPYATVGVFKYISPQDVFLSSLAFCIVILIFLVAPYIPSRRRECILPIPYIPKMSKCHKGWCFSWDRSRCIGAVTLFFVLSIVISFIAALTVYVCLLLFDLTLLFPGPKSEGGLSDYALLLFLITFLISGISSVLFFVKTKIQMKKIKDDFRDLLLFFCFLPAIIVASLVLAKNDLIIFPNLFGIFVVGALLISGFFTIMTLTTISFSLKGNVWGIWRCLVSASLAAISGFSALFLWLPLQETEDFGKILSFSVATMILILLYGFLYEKMKKYRFTEWWRREWRPVAMIVSILVILVVGAINPEIYLFNIDTEFEDDLNNSIISEKLEDVFKDEGFLHSENVTITKGKEDEWIITAEESFIVRKEDGKLNIYTETTAGWGVPCKLVWVFGALFFMFLLPWLCGICKFGIPKYAYEVLKNWELPPVLPEYQGMVLVKAEPSPGKLEEVIKELGGIEGVYQTMVVTGEYDVCLIIEGVDSDDMAEKILDIRKIKGVASTTTLTDIRESFDMEVRYK